MIILKIRMKIWVKKIKKKWKGTTRSKKVLLLQPFVKNLLKFLDKQITSKNKLKKLGNTKRIF